MIDLWMEGYSMSGGKSKAKFIGTYKADNLCDAIEIFFSGLDNSCKCYANNESMTYFGCKFFDNEADARASFG